MKALIVLLIATAACWADPPTKYDRDAAASLALASAKSKASPQKDGCECGASCFCSGSNSCGCIAVTRKEDRYEWLPTPFGNFALMKNGSQVGTYYTRTESYTPYLGKNRDGQAEWGEPCDPPVSPPRQKHLAAPPPPAWVEPNPLTFLPPTKAASFC